MRAWLRREVTPLRVWLFLFTGLVAGALWLANDARDDVARQALANCQEIEQIKTGARAAAWRDFNNLDQNLDLLGIRKTPQILDAAKATRNRRLEQFKREPCPRKILNPSQKTP